MKGDIVRFCRMVGKLYGLEAVYFPGVDVYSLRKKGRGVQNFNSINFYQLPQRWRKELIGRLLKVGLNHNLGEKTVKNQLFLARNQGKYIYK